MVGASSGLGREVAELLANVYTVHAWARTWSDDKSSAYHIRSVDVTDDDAIRRSMASSPTRFDVLVYCAAAITTGEVGDDSPRTWRNIFDTNVVGLISILYHHKTIWGHIPPEVVIVGSEAAYFAAPTRGAYHASKAALASVAVTLQAEHRSSGARVTLLSPGRMDTQFTPQNTPGARLDPHAVAGVIGQVLSAPSDIEFREIRLGRPGQTFGR